LFSFVDTLVLLLPAFGLADRKVPSWRQVRRSVLRVRWARSTK